MTSTKALIAAVLLAALANTPLAFAEDDHKAHHPEGAAPKAEAAPPSQGGMGMGMGNGMMNPEHMKQMREMCGKMMGGDGKMPMMAPQGDNGAASQAYSAANGKMHEAMSFPFSGDADADFAKGMIAHHQGAIDMAKVVLQYGKDEKLHKLAEDIIKAQGPEIAMMTEWLKSHGK